MPMDENTTSEPASLAEATQFVVEAGATREVVVRIAFGATAEMVTWTVNEASCQLVFQLSSDPDLPLEESAVLGIRVEGLPSEWYTLSSGRLLVASGQSHEALLVLHPPFVAGLADTVDYSFDVRITRSGGAEVVGPLAQLNLEPPSGTTMRSRLLRYLPDIYTPREDESDFIHRFLLVFQGILDPVESLVDETNLFLNPDLTPARFLPWLASWLDVSLEPTLQAAQKRALIRRAIPLARWKGTRLALREEMRLQIGGRSLVVENFDGMRLGQDAALGVNTNLGVRRDSSVTVTLVPDNGAPIDLEQADELLEDLTPANVSHVVRVAERPIPAQGDAHG